MTGARRGGSDVSVDLGENTVPESYSFSGDIASLAGPDGGHFLGSGDPNVVVGFDSTGTHNIGRDTPLNDDGTSAEQQSGSTYHIGVGTGTITPGEQHSDTFNGYAAGFVQQAGGGAPDTLLNTSPSDVKVSLDAATNTMTASVHVGDGAILPNPRYNLEFGGQGHSAFIDDAIFAAFEKPGASSIEETVLVPQTVTLFEGTRWEYQFTTYKPEDETYVPDIQSYFVSADAINANAVLFPGQTVNGVQKRAFCQTCDYIKWGAWGTRASYQNHDGQQVTDDVHLGWWIAGDVVSSSDMPTRGSASYAGDAIGTVASKQQDGSWNQYVATGDMDMKWYFAARSGTLNIRNFDNKNLSGVMFAPGKANFDGPLVGPSGIIGTASGSFVGSPGFKQAPAGVIGNFGVGNAAWKANGIFGGVRQ